MKKFLAYLLLFILSYQASVLGQLDLKRDDFVGNQRRNWWQWHHDGPNTPYPTVQNGLVLFSLVDPDSTYLPYCDAAFWDGYPPYGGPYLYCTVTLRAKALNPHRNGSRGWGLWFSEPWPNIQQQIWFMESKDYPDLTQETWWRAETAFGIDQATHYYVDLDNLPEAINMESWHTYKIIRQPAYIELLIDNNQVLYVTQDLPDRALAFHIWVDNLVYEYAGVGDINIYRRSWTGKNELVLDYVQILSSGSLESSETPSGIKLLREMPNEIGDGQPRHLWKQYNYDSPGGSNLVLVTGRVERYLDSSGNPLSDDDDVRLVVDGTDYGWETPTSLNADALGTVSRTLVLSQNSTTPGSKSIEVYSDITPLLYDVTVLGSEYGGAIINNEYNETGSGGTDYLFKEITFPSYAGQVAIYVSGSADEDPSPSNRGYQYSDFDDNADDDLRIELDGVDYGYQTTNSLWGNRLFGEPKSILIVNTLAAGTHTLRLYANNTPTLNRVVIYGEFYDASLPVTLSSFKVNAAPNANVLEWKTESEINNLGFNIYKAAGQKKVPVSQLQFFRLNPILIQGAGISNRDNFYSYTDRAVQDNWYYWYRLEDVDFNGKTTQHEIVEVQRNVIDPVEKFSIGQNYPNPFNQTTRIPYEITKPAPVLIEIFSITGEAVYHANLGIQSEGRHSIVWSGKDNNGLDMPTGIYYYRIRTNNRSLVRSMLLIR